MKKVVVVGRLNNWNGIGQIAYGFLTLLANVCDLYFVNTRAEDSHLELLPKGVTLIAGGAQSGEEFDICIFCDVTSNGSADKNYLLCPPARLRYIYSIFDSTTIPAFWIDIINGRFDALLVATRSQADIYQFSGVKTPIFEIPIAVEDPGEGRPWHKAADRPLVFGFVGSNEPRKNIEKLIRCFRAEFGDDDSVKLMVRTGLDFTNSTQQLLATGGGNVEVSNELSKSKAEYFAALQDIDVFVSLSKGEGYSIVPREMLMLGRPVVLSGCLAHGDLMRVCEANGPELALRVDALHEVPAFYPHVGDSPSYYGVQFDCEDEDVMSALRRIVDDASAWFSDEALSCRREVGLAFTRARLQPVYKALVDPVMIRVGKAHQVDESGYRTLSADFYMRAKRALGFEELRNGSVYCGKKYHVPLHDAGFFSLYNRFLSHLAWVKEASPGAHVLPHWHAEQLTSLEKVGSFCYSKPGQGNLWSALFESEDAGFNAALREFTTNTVPSDSIELGDFNEFNEPWLTYTNAYNFYFHSGFQEARKKYSYYVNRYLRPNASIRRFVEDFSRENFSGKTVISVHIRHPSHSMEQPDGKIAGLDLFVEKIDELIRTRKLADFIIFLATDQDFVVAYMRKIYGGAIRCCDHVSRVSVFDQQRFEELSREEKSHEGHQIQHMMAANTSTWSSKLAEEVIIDASLLACGDYFIHVTSNIATAVAFMNPNLEMVYCK